ncbi:MAG: hypothetical protein J2P54_00065 [Bradyrhizobiaceae bacterium]|nr:hypothetical protein [Bradyrhizobiaceae bacterium]
MTQQLVSQLTLFFSVIMYLVLAIIVCIRSYQYIAAAVETRSIFHTRVRMTVPLALLFVGPRMALRQFDVPTGVAMGLTTVSVLALVGICALALSRLSRPREP